MLPFGELRGTDTGKICRFGYGLMIPQRFQSPLGLKQAGNAFALGLNYITYPLVLILMIVKHKTVNLFQNKAYYLILFFINSVILAVNGNADALPVE